MNMLTQGSSGLIDQWASDRCLAMHSTGVGRLSSRPWTVCQGHHVLGSLKVRYMLLFGTLFQEFLCYCLCVLQGPAHRANL